VWLVWLYALVSFGTAGLLFVGLWTQAAAIVGILLSLKHGLAPRKYSAIIPLSRAAFLLLFVICLSLLVTGAGALAFDLPL
jgi:hypothetical protein